MAHWFFDPFGIGVDMDTVRAVSPQSGSGQYDGYYMIFLTIIVSGSPAWEMTMLYNDKETRDTILRAMSERLITL